LAEQNVPRTFLASITCLLLASGCGQENESYFPLDAGHSCEYQIKERLVQIERISRLLVVNLGKRRFDGGSAYLRQINTERLEVLQDTKNGIERLGVITDEEPLNSSEAGLVLARPWQIGTQWQQTSVTAVLQTTVDPFRRLYRVEQPIDMTYTIELLDDVVTTPAGTFTNCLRVRGKGEGFFKGDKTVRGAAVRVEHLDWYAPGVGLVKSDRLEITESKIVPGGRYTLELVRFD
jgi:hypothetical protein